MSKERSSDGHSKTARTKTGKTKSRLKVNTRLPHSSRLPYQLKRDQIILANFDSKFKRIVSKFLPLNSFSESRLKNWVTDKLIEAEYQNKIGPDHIVAKIIRLSWHGFRQA